MIIIKKNKYPLFHEKPNEQLSIKPFKSFLEKTYRINILNNTEFPKPPKEGWLSPENWYSQINDIIRTKIVCNYIDGVLFLSQKLQELCGPLKSETCNVDYKAYIDGYYAVHIHISAESEITSVKWDTEKINTQFELQITSQLQDFVKEIIHEFYNENRTKIKNDEIPWQWDIKSEDFETNYIGHFLQYFDKKIYEMRNRAGGMKNE